MKPRSLSIFIAGMLFLVFVLLLNSSVHAMSISTQTYTSTTETTVCSPESLPILNEEDTITRAEEVKNEFYNSVCHVDRDCDEYYEPLQSEDDDEDECIQTIEDLIQFNQNINTSLSAVSSCLRKIKGFGDKLRNMISPYSNITLLQFTENAGQRFRQIINVTIPELHSFLFGDVGTSESPYLEEYFVQVTQIASGCQCKDVNLFWPELENEDSSWQSSADYSYDQIDIKDYIATELRKFSETLRSLQTKLECRSPNVTAEEKHNKLCPHEPGIC